MKNLVLVFFLFSIILMKNWAENAENYDYKKEIDKIENVIKSFNIKAYDNKELTKDEIESLLTIGAKNELNLFELLYITYEHISKVDARIKILGKYLRELETKITYGDKRVYSIIPINIIEEVQLGLANKTGLSIIDIYFKETYEKYVEIGTAIYEKHIGFAKVENYAFLKCFGMKVKKLGITKSIDKIEMYKKNKIAIYIKDFFKPKIWAFNHIFLNLKTK